MVELLAFFLPLGFFVALAFQLMQCVVPRHSTVMTRKILTGIPANFQGSSVGIFTHFSEFWRNFYQSHSLVKSMSKCSGLQVDQLVTAVNVRLAEFGLECAPFKVRKREKERRGRKGTGFLNEGKQVGDFNAQLEKKNQLELDDETLCLSVLHSKEVLKATKKHYKATHQKSSLSLEQIARHSPLDMVTHFALNQVLTEAKAPEFQIILPGEHSLLRDLVQDTETSCTGVRRQDQSSLCVSVYCWTRGWSSAVRPCLGYQGGHVSFGAPISKDCSSSQIWWLVCF